jgi:hypothetical protein
MSAEDSDASRYSRRRIGTPRFKEAFVILSLFRPVFNGLGLTLHFRLGGLRWCPRTVGDWAPIARSVGLLAEHSQIADPGLDQCGSANLQSVMAGWALTDQEPSTDSTAAIGGAADMNGLRPAGKTVENDPKRR